MKLKNILVLIITLASAVVSVAMGSCSKSQLDSNDGTKTPAPC